MALAAVHSKAVVTKIRLQRIHIANTSVKGQGHIYLKSVSQRVTQTNISFFINVVYDCNNDCIWYVGYNEGF